MNRTFIHRISILVAVVAILASCKRTSPEYTNAIPADASAVVGVNIQSLIDKSCVDDNDKQKVIDAIKGELSAGSFQHVERIIRNGDESGISVKDPVYLFAGESINAGVVMKVGDIEKLERTFDVMISEQVINTVIKENGVHIVPLEGMGICVFNTSALLLIKGSDNREAAIQLLKQDADASIANNVFFKGMSGKKGDITFFATINAMPDPYRDQISRSFHSKENVDPKETGIIGGISFDKGKIGVQIETLSTNEEIARKMKEQNEAFGKLNQAFTSFFPASTLVYAAFNVDGEKLTDMLQSDEQVQDDEIAKLIDKMQDLLKALNGDVSMGLTNMSMNGEPTFVAYAEAKSNAALEALFKSKDNLGIGRGDDIVKLNENEYMYTSSSVNLFFGFKDNFIYITNSKDAKASIGQKDKNPLTTAGYAPNMKGKFQYAVVDIKSILALPVVQLVAMMGGQEAAMYLNVASKVSSLEIVGNGNSQSDINLWLVDRETNALKQIVDLGKQIAGI